VEVKNGVRRAYTIKGMWPWRYPFSISSVTASTMKVAESMQASASFDFPDGRPFLVDESRLLDNRR
jgi:hypothetical protein